jgi:hypothetical protein
LISVLGPLDTWDAGQGTEGAVYAGQGGRACALPGLSGLHKDLGSLTEGLSAAGILLAL